MTDQEQNPTGATPPKISPLTPNPRPPAGPSAPRPITVRAHQAPKTAPGVSPAAPKSAAVNLRATSRVPLPDGIPPSSTVRPATIRLRPVTPPTSVPAASPMQPTTPPAPGSHPLPAGPKPPSQAQIQAAKSKTSRISLDSAIGVAPVSPAGVPKTIRLKRPVDLATAPTVVSKPLPKSATTQIHQTSRIPETAAPATAASPLTQKKTLKIRRPGTASAVAESAPEASDEAAFENLTPIESLNLGGAPKESKAFTVIAVITASLAAIVMILLSLCLGAHAIGPGANKNTLATINGPELPWYGRITD